MNIIRLFSASQVSKVCGHYPHTATTKEMLMSYFLRLFRLKSKTNPPVLRLGLVLTTQQNPKILNCGGYKNMSMLTL